MDFVRLFLLIIGLAVAVGSGPPSTALRPGSLVAPVGEVWLIEDAVTVRYDLQELLYLGELLGPVYTNIQRLQPLLNFTGAGCP